MASREGHRSSPRACFHVASTPCSRCRRSAHRSDRGRTPPHRLRAIRARVRTARWRSGPPCRIRLRLRLPPEPSFGQFRRLGTVVDGGTKPLKFNGTLHLRGERRRALAARGNRAAPVTHRNLRCNTAVVPQFEIRLLRPQVSPRQQENATEHDKYEARPIRFQSKPGTRPTRLQSHWLGRLHCCVTWYCRRSFSSRFTEPPSPDRLSRYE